MTKFLILGAGRRVQEDILPSLEAVGVKPEQISIVRLQRKPIFDQPEIAVYSLSELSTDIIDGAVILSSLPPLVNRRILPELLRIGRPKLLLIDTPVDAIRHDLAAISTVYVLEVAVLEDSVLIPWIGDSAVRNSKFGLFRNSLYYNHGAALISALAKGKVIRLNPWFLTRRQTLLFVSSHFQVFLMAGFKDRSRARGSLRARSLRRLDLTEVGSRTFETVSKEFPLLNIAKVMQVEESKRNPFEEIDAWKRVGLALGLYALVHGQEQLFPSPEQALQFEKLAAVSSSRNLGKRFAIALLQSTRKNSPK